MHQRRKERQKRSERERLTFFSESISSASNGPRSGDETGVPIIRSILSEMKISLILLQAFGFLPELCSNMTTKPETLKNRVRRSPVKFILSLILKLYTLSLIALNVWFFKICVNMIHVYNKVLNLPLLHALVVVPLVTSLKVLYFYLTGK